MTSLIRFALLCLLCAGASAQSSLPPCQGSKAAWTNCFGTETYPSGNKYDGEFNDGIRNGQGTYTFANGDKFVGEYKDGKRYGQGTYTFANGVKFVGEYKDGIRNGQGIVYKPDGTVASSGIWSSDTLVNSFALDLKRFPFNAPLQTARPSSAEIDRLNGDAQVSRQRQQELEQRLAATAAEAEAAKRKQQELQAELDRAKELADSRLNERPRLQNAQRSERRVALVIGNAQYKSSPLENSVNDATDIDQRWSNSF